MKLSIRSQSVKAIKEALQCKIASFPKTVDGYNQSRPFLGALNEIEGNESTHRKNRHPTAPKQSTEPH